MQLPWRLPGAVHSLPEYHQGDIDSINVYSIEQLKIWDIIELEIFTFIYVAIYISIYLDISIPNPASVTSKLYRRLEVATPSVTKSTGFILNVGS